MSKGRGLVRKLTVSRGSHQLPKSLLGCLSVLPPLFRALMMIMMMVMIRRTSGQVSVVMGAQGFLFPLKTLWESSWQQGAENGTLALPGNNFRHLFFLKPHVWGMCLQKLGAQGLALPSRYYPISVRMALLQSTRLTDASSASGMRSTASCRLKLRQLTKRCALKWHV